MLIKRGAEAEIRLVKWYDTLSISKIRIPKPYRNSILDNIIRKVRTLHEAQMLYEAKRSSVNTPSIYFVDPVNCEIIMEYIDGIVLKNIIEKDTKLSKLIGEQVGILHSNDIIHGDLTTSNFLLYNNTIILIDFGLAFRSKRIEDKAVDIRLIKEILSSAHAPLFNELFDLFLDGYSNFVNIEPILNKVKEIESRGRYARVI
jgi:TP53 regulating kinase-like protein